MESTSAFLLGVSLQAGLVVGFGPQNLYVLRNGLDPRGSWRVPLVCSMCDLVLIVLGVTAVGATAARWIGSGSTVRGAACCLLLAYGARALWWGLRSPGTEAKDDSPVRTTSPVLLALGFSLLNPSVWIELLVVLGAVGAGLSPDERQAFALGAGVVSCAWFFGITYAASLLRHLSEGVRFRKCIDLGAAILCLVAAAQLSS